MDCPICPLLDGEIFLKEQPSPQRLTTDSSTTPRSLSWKEMLSKKILTETYKNIGGSKLTSQPRLKNQSPLVYPPMPDWYAHKSNRLVFWPLFPDIFPNTPIPFPMLIQTVEFLSCFNLLQSDIRYNML